MAKLKGQELLAYIQEHAGTDEGAIIQGAGYYGYRNGKLNLQRTKFYRAISQANGLVIGDPVPDERPGKEPTFRLKVGPKGLVPVGRCYTEQCNMKPGTFVKVLVEDGCVILEPEDAAPAECPMPPAATLASIA
jgi:hypothetical protein